MACRNRLCPSFTIVSDVTFAAGVLTLNIPAGTYSNNCRYCLVIADTIPTDATLASTIVVTIGDDATTYPLLLCNGTQATLNSFRIQSRHIYSTVFHTLLGGGGNFRLLNRYCGIADAVPEAVTVEPADDGGAGA